MPRFVLKIILTMLCVLPAQAATITLQQGNGGYSGTSDTYIYASQPTITNGGNPTLTITSANNRALIRFKIFASEGGPLPNGTVINSATLSLYRQTSGTDTVSATRLLKDWSEAQASWNNASTGVTWTTAGALSVGNDIAAAADGQGVFSPNSWGNIDVTASVQAFASGTPNYGWKLSKTTTGTASLNSREWGSTSLRPKLIIDYVEPPPSAPTNLSASSITSSQINLSWTDTSTTETGFKLERKTGSGGTYAQVATPAANAVTASDGGLNPLTTYFYRIRATNAAGDSAYSNEVSASTAPTAGATNGTIDYTYDAFGNLVSTDAGGVVTTLTYDLRGRKTALADPSMGNWTYAYNALGELIRQTDAKSQTTVMVYDVLGRMLTRTEPDLISNWYYDTQDGTPGGAACGASKGKLCKATSDNSYVRTHTYDSLGRLTQTSTTIDSVLTIGYTYDANGRLDTTTYPASPQYPSGFITKNAYNARGYLEKVTDSGATLTYWQVNSMTATGRILTETLGNGLTTTKTYDALDRPGSNKVSGGGADHQHYTYQYDTIGNMTQRVDVVQSNLTENFAYDKLNRLILSTGTGLTTRGFIYDAVGNMTYKSDVGSYSYPAPGSARPHAVASITGTANGFTNPAFSYDANGNMTAGLGRTLTYTSYNMPAQVVGVGYAGGASTTYNYVYNAEHERTKLVHSTLGTFIYLHPAGKGQLLYEKQIEASPSTRIEHKYYISAGGMSVAVHYARENPTPTETATATRYMHQDHLGSVTLITNEAGGVVERLAYEAFGKRRYPAGTDDPTNGLFGQVTDRGFTNHEHLDEIALIHMNGRVYDPVLGRFITADPYLQDPGNLQDYNRYSYVNNNPLMYTDPSGYFSLSKLAKAIFKTTINPSIRNTTNAFHAQFGQEYVDRFVLTHKWAYVAGQSIATSATAVFCGGCGGAIWAAYYTELATGSSNTAAKAGVITFASNYARNYIKTSEWSGPAQVIAAGAFGGLNAELEGGSFKDGFLRPAVTKWANLFYTEFVKSEPDIIGSSDWAPKEEGTHVHPEGKKYSEVGYAVRLGMPHSIFDESSPLMRTIGLIPFVNNFARFHDQLSGWLTDRGVPMTVANFPTYPIAIPFSVAAALDGARPIILWKNKWGQVPEK